MTDVTTSEVEKLVAEWRERAAREKARRCWVTASQGRQCADDLERAIQQDKDRAGEAVATVDVHAMNRIVWVGPFENLPPHGTPLYTRPAAALPEVDEAMVERAAMAYEVDVDGEVYSADVPRIAMRAALTAALRPETQA